ncbi:MAG: CotH kinase family protein [Melioribacteraceae bacterium]
MKYKIIIKYIILYFVLLSVNIAQNNVIINELVSSNINGLVDIKTGEYSDWIEIYNPTDSLVDLSGYYLTDNLFDSTKWQFPTNTFIDSNSYIIVWADDKNSGLHTNFKLDVDGEQLYLFNSELDLIDSVFFGKQRDDVSYGRDTANSSQWHFYSEPTPRNKNKTKGVKSNKLSSTPTLSIQSGFYSESIMLEISSQDGGKIYFTLNGSIPTTSSQLYSEPILIDSTVIVRAIVFEDTLLASMVVSNSYFINDSTQLPIISLTTDPKNLWDDEIGIYTIGTNGISLWNVKANYWQDWERPATIEFFENDKSSAFKVNTGISINGARRNMLQKSFSIHLRNEYGDEFIQYKIFPDKEIRKFTSLVLRNGGYPEFSSTLFRDGFIQNLISKNIDLEYQSYRPAVLYVNGEYWGIYNIREKQNEDYLQQNTGVDPKNVDILENNMLVVEGDNLHYQNMLNFISENDIELQDNYDSLKQMMDIDNFMNYQIAQLFIGNLDWPANNIKYWRQRTIEGKWRWFLYDLDGGFGLWSNYDHNTITYATEENSSQWNNAPWSTFLFRNLLKNQNFADYFIQKYAAYLSYSFNSANVVSLIDSFQNNIENEIPKHINRWLYDCSNSNPQTIDGCVFENLETWLNNISVIKEFADKRPQFVKKELIEYFALTDTFNLAISINNNKAGTIFVNGVKHKENYIATLFTDKEIVLEAIPKAGYRFVAWTGDLDTNSSCLNIKLNKGTNLEAVFQSIGQYSKIPKTITSNYELKKTESPFIIDDDIYISENATLSIYSGVEIFIEQNKNIFVYGNLRILGTLEEPVYIQPINFAKKWGAINFINSNGKSTLINAKIFGTTKGKDELNQIGGISSYNSDIELNHLEIDSVQFPIFAQFGNFVMRNSKIHTNFTSDLVNVKYGSAIIEGCEFTGGYAIDIDAIDYDDVKSGIIRRNIIHGFLSENSDGIDIGEGAENILIEDNIIYNCYDKGISVGQASNAIIKGNVISNCNMGIGIKDESSYGFVDHNTFYKNGISVSAYEKTIGKGGGKADVTNSIFSNSTISDIFFDEYSNINVSYSLSDKELLNGVGNIFDDPVFFNPDSLDLRVDQNSPAFDNGDPNYTLDPDGTRTNIGASFATIKSNNIIFSEINYHSNSLFDSKDWVELHNPNDFSIDLTNWIFKDSEDEHIFLFPNGTIIPENNYLVLCENGKEFSKLYPNIKNFFGDFEFGLNNSGEKIRLYDNFGNIIDSLTYEDKYPWPTKADGGGFTLQLINYFLDNSKPENWESELLYGSPGNQNIITDIEIHDAIVPSSYRLFQNYPNPFNPITTIKFDISKSSRVTLKVYDVLGKEVLKLIDEKKEAGSYTIQFDGNKLSSGIYFYQITANEFTKTLKMILLK